MGDIFLPCSTYSRGGAIVLTAGDNPLTFSPHLRGSQHRHTDTGFFMDHRANQFGKERGKTDYKFKALHVGADGIILRPDVSERLVDRTKTALIRYLADVRSLPNESAKTHRFSALIGEVFPGTSAPTDFASGVEK